MALILEWGRELESEDLRNGNAPENEPENRNSKF
jgi:hypothetical protein